MINTQYSGVLCLMKVNKHQNLATMLFFLHQS